jgi:hypothetical protein
MASENAKHDVNTKQRTTVFMGIWGRLDLELAGGSTQQVSKA